MDHRCGELWCNPYRGKGWVPLQNRKRDAVQAEEAAAVRASISFPRELYQTLEEIARQKKVSLAWVVRDAAEQYVADKWPLFKGQV
jgi:hypothetical protein